MAEGMNGKAENLRICGKAMCFTCKPGGTPAVRRAAAPAPRGEIAPSHGRRTAAHRGRGDLAWFWLCGGGGGGVGGGGGGNIGDISMDDCLRFREKRIIMERAN